MEAPEYWLDEGQSCVSNTMTVTNSCALAVRTHFTS